MRAFTTFALAAIALFLAAHGLARETSAVGVVERALETARAAEGRHLHPQAPAPRGCEGPAPAHFGEVCGCGGYVDCAGACTRPRPRDPSCAATGGVSFCDGTCSVVCAPDAGRPCGCGGRVTCFGGCTAVCPSS